MKKDSFVPNRFQVFGGSWGVWGGYGGWGASFRDGMGSGGHARVGWVMLGEIGRAFQYHLPITSSRPYLQGHHTLQSSQLTFCEMTQTQEIISHRVQKS